MLEKQVKGWIRFSLNLLMALIKIPLYQASDLTLRILLKFKLFSAASFCFQGRNVKYLRLITKISLDDLVLNHEAEGKIQKTVDFLEDIVEKKMPMAQTDEFREMLVNVERGYKPKGCMTESDVDKYFKDLFFTYENMLSLGYQPQSKIRARYSTQALNRHVSAAWPLPHESNARIGANGKYFWVSQGLHRIAIAKFLEIKSIFVLIVDSPREQLEIYLREFY